MKDTTGILAVLDRRIQALKQSRPEFRPELKDLLEARATIAELMAVFEAFLDLPLQRSAHPDALNSSKVPRRS